MELKKRILDHLDIPERAVTKSGYMEIIGNNEIYIEGVTSVLDYSESEICLRIGKKALRINGMELVIESFDGKRAYVSGEIADIEFESASEL